MLNLKRSLMILFRILNLRSQNESVRAPILLQRSPFLQEIYDISYSKFLCNDREY